MSSRSSQRKVAAGGFAGRGRAGRDGAGRGGLPLSRARAALRRRDRERGARWCTIGSFLSAGVVLRGPGRLPLSRDQRGQACSAA